MFGVTWGEAKEGFDDSIQWNIVSKGLGSERMSFYLSEAANDVRDIMMPSLAAEAAKAKL